MVFCLLLCFVLGSRLRHTFSLEDVVLPVCMYYAGLKGFTIGFDKAVLDTRMAFATRHLLGSELSLGCDDVNVWAFK